MDNRSHEAGASATPPSSPVSPSAGYPTDGNPGTGTPATRPGAFWFHQLGEEIRGVIAAAGITPLVSDLTQLLTALRSAGVFQTQASSDNSTKVATTAWVRFGFVVSLGINGYIKLPDWLGGLILQWGSSTVTAGTANTITFPVAFPTELFNYTPHITDSGITASHYVSRTAASTSGAITIANAGGPWNYGWWAVGH